MQNKQFQYNRVRIFGASIFILLSLVTGPLAGYFLGEYVVNKFSLPTYILFICIAVGFLSSLLEVVRIARFLLKEEEK